jgi:serine/threonine-protein kinase
MGEVYRARDRRLDRDVAIKVVSDLLTADADRLARFRREAQVLASLNHPNIAHVYGFEEASTAPAGAAAFLVMELVEGRTLAEVIDAGQGLCLEDALAIGRQIALGLEAAHEQGIVHRDLKPANVKLRDDGTVKVLDFGLAKAVAANTPGAAADAMSSPTLTNRATQLGMILGTAAYMSPEQAKGRPVDKRADIWAFGVVLYEMLTGRRLFDGDSVAETIGLVATREPDWTALPPGTPTRVRRLLGRCLTRDPKERLRDIGEARIALGDADAATEREPQRAVAAAPRPSLALMIASGLTLAVVAGTAGWLWGSRLTGAPDANPAPYRAEIVPTPADAFNQRSTAALFTFTPDGEALIYASADPAARRLYRRNRNAPVAIPIAGTEGAYGPCVSHAMAPRSASSRTAR